MALSTEADLIFAGPVELAERVRAKELHPRELVELSLRRIEALNPRLNAFRVTMAEEALAAAESVSDGPLAGVPVAIKDEMRVAGQPLTHGTRDERGRTERRQRARAPAAGRRRHPDRHHQGPGADDLAVDGERRQRHHP